MVRQINHNDDILFKQLREFEKKKLSAINLQTNFIVTNVMTQLEAVLLIFKIVFFFGAVMRPDFVYIVRNFSCTKRLH